MASTSAFVNSGKDCAHALESAKVPTAEAIARPDVSDRRTAHRVVAAAVDVMFASLVDVRRLCIAVQRGKGSLE
jgi:hypothetical protein